MYLQKQVHTSPKELCGAVFRVPTCCSWGKINVEQAKGRNAFKAPLIELDGLQSQRQSLNKARAGEILRCASHVHIIKPAALAHGSTVPMHISETVGIIWESCLEGGPPTTTTTNPTLLQNESPLAVNEGEVLPCWGPLGRPLNRGTFLSNSVWPEPNMPAEGQRIQEGGTDGEGGKVGKIGCGGVRGKVTGNSWRG